MQELGVLPPSLMARYELRGSLGRGGFATVYLAQDKNVSDRQVALKLYHPRTDDERNQRAKEVEILGRLKHPNIVRVYDGGIADGQDFIVMEYLEGGSLRDRMGGAPMRQADALGLISVLADALQAAHEDDILHLDIKPENILFDKRGRPFLTDFGIGRIMGGDGETRQTRAMGTSDYASPEQRQGGRLTPQSDIYSLGVVLFELLVGQVPLGPASAIPQPPFSPPFPNNHPLTASRELVMMLCKAIAVSPSIRYESSLDFARRIRDYLARGGSDTGGLARLGAPRTRQFAAPNIARVQIQEPQHQLRTAEGRRVPTNARELGSDLPPVPQGTRVTQLMYSHQALEIGVNSLLEQGVFVRGRLRIRQDAIVRGDVISLTLLDISQGVQARNLIAPEILLRGSVRLEGSLFCRTLRSTGERDQEVHLPAGCEIGGSLILGKGFEKIVPDDQMGRPLSRPREPIETFGEFPTIRIGSGCTMIAILGDAHIDIESHQKQLNTIRVEGNVTVGSYNTVRRIEGDNVTIGPNCVVDEVHARGKLIVGQGSRIGYMRAGQGIVLDHHVTISSPILYSDNGAIVENGEAHWNVEGQGERDLTAENLFEYRHEGRVGGLGTTLIDHRLYELYEAIAPGWLPRLSPARFQGAGDQVRQEALPDEEEYLEFSMDLTLAQDRSRALSGPIASEPTPAAEPLDPAAPPPSEAATQLLAEPAPSPAAAATEPSERPTRHLDESPDAGPLRRGPDFGGRRHE